MKKQETAECNVCKEKIPATDQAMMYHLVTKHPMDLVTSKSFIEKASGFFYKLGGALADKMMRKP